ncbi:PREDICTED: uncharacterized protein LOC106789925 [Polistes canadensis]|uniref:uncharacterized protein LOC106789925 n=1 Tax=Polistes canadensis TaxID=91411 RepID=UPI000718F5E7|nr:PREDICTED: uncharacterized protein LOC106789925 [Polistes canadensis]
MDISTILKIQGDDMKGVNRKKNVTSKDLIPSITITPSPISEEENGFYRLMFGNDISKVRFRKIHCTACDVHIGSAPAEAKNMLSHPVLRTLLCAKCNEFYGDGTFEQGDDATDMFCRWCANGGNLYCCSYCSNTFCYKCIKRNFDPLVRKKIEADEKWKCFVCNPADLYSARATCWALLQHVQTVTRILQNDKTLTPEEFQEKMNLDESECCPRRRKRKRKRTGSTDLDEDEDETYDPSVNNEPITTRRRVLKRKYKHRRLTISNGSIPRLLPIKQCCSSSTENSPKPPEVSTSLSSVPSVKTANTSAKPSNTLGLSVPSKTQENQLSSRPNQTIQEKVDAPNVKTTYNANITAVPTVKLLQSTAVFKPMQTILTSHVSSKNSFQTTYYPTARMVTIPSAKHSMVLNRPRVLLPKPKKMIKMVVTPNVINLDSDSDEPLPISLVNSQNIQNTPPVDNNITVNANSSSTIAVPVALVSTDNSCNTDRIQVNEVIEQPLRELDTTLKKPDESLDQTVLHPYKEQFNEILDNFKVKFNQIFEDTQSEDTNKNSIQETRYKIRSLYNKVYSTIIQMAYINDKVIRDYNSWERSQNVTSEIIEESISRRSSFEENNEIPLDMICVADSCEESDHEDVTTIKLSELLLSTNAFKHFSDKKKMVNKSVETSSIVCKDKSIQVFDFESKDYEKIIGHSVLMKSNNDSSTKDSILPSIAMQSEHVGKYEEQFILYLQHIEDHGIEIDDTSNEIVLESLIGIETDSSSTSETLINEIPSNNLNESTKLFNLLTFQGNREKNSKTKTLNNSLEAESILSISKPVSNNLRIKEIPTNKTNINTELEKEYTTMTDDTIHEKQKINVKKAIETVINTLISNETNVTTNLNNSTPEDDITIIED